jgi:4-carboxymuconolactone decarboxylase
MRRNLIVACLLAIGIVLGVGLSRVVAAQNPGPNAPPPNPNDVRMVGDRFAPLAYKDMTPAQKTMFEHLVSGERRGASGPFNALLRSPEMGDLAQEFGAAMRYHSSIPSRLNELAIIITARHWTSQYEWYAHRRAAQQAGLSQSVIDAVAAGARPAAMKPDEDAVYTFVNELLTTKQVSDTTYATTKALFGERGVVDLIGVSGYYTLVSMLLNVDRHPLPAGVSPELTPLR